MMFLYTETVLKFMNYLDFKSYPILKKVFKSFLYFSGIPLSFIRVVSMQINFWKWARFMFSDISTVECEYMLNEWKSPFYIFTGYITDILPNIFLLVSLYVMNLFGRKKTNETP